MYSWNQQIEQVCQTGKLHNADDVGLSLFQLFQLFEISFTWKGWSRHNKTLKVVGMSIGNLSGKPLDAHSGHLKI